MFSLIYSVLICVRVLFPLSLLFVPMSYRTVYQGYYCVSYASTCVILSDFPWLLEFSNFEHTDRKRELSGPRPLRGVQVDSSKSTI